MQTRYIVALFAVGIVAIVGAGLLTLRPGPDPGEMPPAPELSTDPESPGEGPESLHRRLETADLVSLYPEHVLRHGSPDRPVVALTFDDGPDDDFTPRVLDILRREGVKATFFVTGVRAENHPTVLRRIVRDGHVAASHGYQHARYSVLTPAQIKADLDANRRLLEKAGSSHSYLFRPPYGAMDVQAAETVIGLNHKIILWSVDTRDWQERSADDIAGTVFAETRPGSIVLQHSAGGPGQNLAGTVEALPRIISRLKREGYEFVTIPEMLSRSVSR